jgi:hypothetical protein
VEDEIGAGASPAEPDKKPIWTRWWMIALYVILGITVIGSLGSEDDGSGIAANEVTTTVPIVESSTTIGTTTSTADQITSTTAAANTTTSESAQTPQPGPVEFSGSGNEVIEFADDLVWLQESFGIFSYTVGGSGNNAIWGLDPDFEVSDLLVNTIGGQEGTRFIGLTSDAVGLEVEVSGEWAISVKPPTKLFPPRTAADFNVPVIDTTGTYEGAVTEAVGWTGPNVIALKTDGRIAEISATGDGNIAIWAYSTSGATELLVNEIDVFEGSVRLPDCSDGCWIDIDGEVTYSLTIRE